MGVQLATKSINITAIVEYKRVRFTSSFIKKVGQYASKNSLMANDENIFLSLEFHDYTF